MLCLWQRQTGSVPANQQILRRQKGQLLLRKKRLLFVVAAAVVVVAALLAVAAVRNQVQKPTPAIVVARNLARTEYHNWAGTPLGLVVVA